MELLVLLSGKKEIIIQENALSDNIQIVKLDEKQLSQPNAIKTILKSNKYDKVYFGTIDAEFQRFQFFIFLYIIIYNSGNGSIVDQSGNIISNSYSKFFFSRLPMFIIEIFVSIIIAIVYHIKLPYLKWKLTTKQ